MNEASTRESPLLVDRKHMPFQLDGGIATRAALGLIVLATDHTMEHEWRAILGGLSGIAFYESRLYNAPEVNETTLAAMEKDIAPATALILPGDKLDVVAFGCTSGAMVIGEDKVFAHIRAARPGIACTTPITGAVEGLKALGARRIALLTPYIDRINRAMRAYIEARGFQVPVMGSFNHEDDNEVARISAASIRDAAIALGREPSVDAVFVSCTSLRVAEIAGEIEQAIGKPVTSSNHAMAWHALRLAGVADRLPQFGRLFTL
jgi:maleate isomerase